MAIIGGEVCAIHIRGDTPNTSQEQGKNILRRWTKTLLTKGSQDMAWPTNAPCTTRNVGMSGSPAGRGGVGGVGRTGAAGAVGPVGPVGPMGGCGPGGMPCDPGRPGGKIMGNDGNIWWNPWEIARTHGKSPRFLEMSFIVQNTSVDLNGVASTVGSKVTTTAKTTKHNQTMHHPCRSNYFENQQPRHYGYKSEFYWYDRQRVLGSIQSWMGSATTPLSCSHLQATLFLVFQNCRNSMQEVGWKSLNCMISHDHLQARFFYLTCSMTFLTC